MSGAPPARLGPRPRTRAHPTGLRVAGEAGGERVVAGGGGLGAWGGGRGGAGRACDGQVATGVARLCEAAAGPCKISAQCPSN